MMSFPALSVNISPASFLKYTTYPSNSVVSPMMTNTMGGAERNETYSNSTVEKMHILCRSYLLHSSSAADRWGELTYLPWAQQINKIQDSTDLGRDASARVLE